VNEDEKMSEFNLKYFKIIFAVNENVEKVFEAYMCSILDLLKPIIFPLTSSICLYVNNTNNFEPLMNVFR